MTEGARRQCRLALTRKNTETNDELQLALFSSNDWSEESRQVKATRVVSPLQAILANSTPPRSQPRVSET